MPRGGKWKTGASAERAGYMAAYRAGVNKGAKEMGGGSRVSIPKEVTKHPTELAFAGETQANNGTGSPRSYGKDPGRQTALAKDGANVEHAGLALPAIRDSAVPGDVAKAITPPGAIPDFPGPVKGGSI